MAESRRGGKDIRALGSRQLPSRKFGDLAGQTNARESWPEIRNVRGASGRWCGACTRYWRVEPLRWYQNSDHRLLDDVMSIMKSLTYRGRAVVRWCLPRS